MKALRLALKRARNDRGVNANERALANQSVIMCRRRRKQKFGELCMKAAYEMPAPALEISAGRNVMVAGGRKRNGMARVKNLLCIYIFAIYASDNEATAKASVLSAVLTAYLLLYW